MIEVVRISHLVKYVWIAVKWGWFISSASPWRHFGEYSLNVNNLCCSVSASPCMLTHTLFTFKSKHALWYSPKWRQGDAEETNCWIKEHKKCSRSFVKWRLNPWCHKDYFNNILLWKLHFWTLIVVGSLLYMGGSESSQNSSKIS